MRNSLLSVIIPVYNSQSYLRECLDSVLSSNYKNMEVVLVDDGSTDDSLAICLEYAGKDGRVTVFSQKNQGASAARNKGLEHAHGEYVTFVDSDDAVSPAIYPICVQAMEQEQADLVAFEDTTNPEVMMQAADKFSGKIRILDDPDSICSVLAMLPETRSFTWTYCHIHNKLYRREKITSLFDTDCVVGENMRFNWMYVQNCRKMAVIPVHGYYYRENENSLTRQGNGNPRSIKAYRNAISDAKVLCGVAQNDQNLSPRLQHYLEARAGYATHQALWRLACGNALGEYPEFAKYGRENLKKYWFPLLRERDCEFRVRIMAALCRFSYPLWNLAAKILGR